MYGLIAGPCSGAVRREVDSGLSPFHASKRRQRPKLPSPIREDRFKSTHPGSWPGRAVFVFRKAIVGLSTEVDW